MQRRFHRSRASRNCFWRSDHTGRRRHVFCVQPFLGAAVLGGHVCVWQGQFQRASMEAVRLSWIRVGLRTVPMGWVGAVDLL